MKVMGMMSGTSLDGVDAALLEVGGTAPGTFSWQLLGFHSESYLPEERNSIRRAIERGGPAELARLHTALGERFARCALAGCARAGVDPESVAAIGSHGQTVWARSPFRGRPRRYPPAGRSRDHRGDHRHTGGERLPHPRRGGRGTRGAAGALAGPAALLRARPTARPPEPGRDGKRHMAARGFERRARAGLRYRPGSRPH